MLIIMETYRSQSVSINEWHYVESNFLVDNVQFLRLHLISEKNTIYKSWEKSLIMPIHHHKKPLSARYPGH